MSSMSERVKCLGAIEMEGTSLIWDSRGPIPVWGIGRFGWGGGGGGVVFGPNRFKMRTVSRPLCNLHCA